MSSIGSVLKDARNKKSVSLEEVHAKIKIHPRVLQLLEEDKFDKLPSPLFVKSFLKSYADFLELNAESLLETYHKEGEKAPEQEIFIRTAEERAQAGKPISRGLIALGVVSFAIGIIVAGSLYFFRMNPHKIPSIRLPHLKIKTDKEEAVAPALAEKPASKKNEHSKKTETAKKPNEWLRSVALGNFPVIDSRAPLELKVKAVDTVWLHITSDGKVIYQGILRRGSSETWTASDVIEIWTGNASNIFLTLNRYALASPGKGVVKKMIISRQGVKIASPANP